MLAGFVLVTLFLAFTRGQHVQPVDLVVGDCLFVRTSTAADDVRPIGTTDEVSHVLLAGGAERAACDASHGHEVSAIVVPELATPAPSALPLLLDAAAIRRVAAPLCEAAFASYVGRTLAGSTYITFPAVPDADGAEAWLDGGRHTVCLVARADGAWMHHPARGTGE